MLESRLLVGLVASILGAILALLVQRLLNKRGLFTYFVWHDPVGLSTEDSVFGTVRVTWNNNPVRNLYLSRVELRNESLNDYEDIVVRVLASDTALLSESTQIVGTTRFLLWTEEFSRQLSVAKGDVATLHQIELIRRQREFHIPTMNRGQKIQLSFLNDATPGKVPWIGLELLHKGVKLEFRVSQQQFMGVPGPSAALVGSALGIVFLLAVVLTIEVTWLAATLCLAFGLTVQIPGALAIKSWRWFRNSIGN